MSSGLDVPFDRVTYRDLQLLQARDLRDDVRRDARLRWLHTRYLHLIWGIAFGFEVQPSTDQTAVAVGPGYAVDSAGRDLVLPDSIELAVPATIGPTTFVLIAGYQEDAAFPNRRDLSSLCLEGGLDPRHERPLLAWVRQDDARFGPQVPLAQGEVTNGHVSVPLDVRPRRYARRLARPHVGWGSTEAGNTGWVVGPLEEHRMWLTATIDTSEAGFTKVPFYFARLRIGPGAPTTPPWLTSVSGPTATSDQRFSTDGFTLIANPDVDYFEYQVLQLPGLPISRIVDPTVAEKEGWSIDWLGIEPTSSEVDQ
jgi:hypothetical protein